MTALTSDNQTNLDLLSDVFTPAAYVRSWSSFLLEQYVSISASISSSVDIVISFLLSQDVVFENINDVESFLKNNYGVVAYLYDVPKNILENFGKSNLKIGVFSDPDSNDDLTELYIEVETSLTPEEANGKLSEINRNWLIASNDQDLMSLNITLKFL